MPWQQYWTLSYQIVRQLFTLWLMSQSVNCMHSCGENRRPSGNKFSFIILMVSSPCSKHGRSPWPIIIISTRMMILSACSWRAIKPVWSSFLNLVNFFDFSPPSRSINSYVSLNGAFSNLSPWPGAFESKNPKSIWTMWPSPSISMFWLCLSLIWST